MYSITLDIYSITLDTLKLCEYYPVYKIMTI